MEYKDYYKILEVDQSAPQSEIKKSYRRLAKKYHPDMNRDDKAAETKFKEVNEAYEVLGDEEKRKKYDAFGSNYNFAGGADFDPSQFGFGGGFTGTSSGHSDFFDMFFGSGGIDLDSIFSGGFSNRKTSFTHAQHNPTRVQDTQATFSISLYDAFHGAKKNVRILGKSIKMTIPAGILSGEKLRIKGQGQHGGDLIVTVEIEPNAKFELDGLDMIQKVNITPWEAALEEKVMIETMNGEKLSIPMKTKNVGKRMRIPNKGYRNRKGQRGTLYIVPQLVMPAQISEKEKQLYKGLAETSNFNARR